MKIKNKYNTTISLILILTNILLLLLLVSSCGKDIDNIDEEGPSRPNFKAKSLDSEFEEQGIDAVSDGDYIRIEWKPNTEQDLEGYKLFRGESSNIDSSWIELTNDLDLNDSSYTDRDFSLLSESNWYYRLSAYDGNENDSDTSIVIRYKLLYKPNISLEKLDNNGNIRVTVIYQGELGSISYILRFYEDAELISVYPIEELINEPTRYFEYNLEDDLGIPNNINNLRLRVDVSPNPNSYNFEGSESEIVLMTE